MTIAILRHQIYWQKQAFLLSTIHANTNLDIAGRQERQGLATAVHTGTLTPDALKVRGEDGRLLYPMYQYGLEIHGGFER